MVGDVSASVQLFFPTQLESLLWEIYSLTLIRMSQICDILE